MQVLSWGQFDQAVHLLAAQFADSAVTGVYGVPRGGLCLAVALLALHMESWLTVVPDLINNLTTPPEQAVVKLPCLLELLTVLPEEVENFKVGIMPRRRQEFRKMLKEAGVQVLQRNRNARRIEDDRLLLHLSVLIEQVEQLTAQDARHDQL